MTKEFAVNSNLFSQDHFITFNVFSYLFTDRIIFNFEKAKFI